jgi:hypothetical protein
MRHRIKRLEAASAANLEVTLLEAVLWSYEPSEKRTGGNPAYVSFCKRLERSKLGRLLRDKPAALPHRQQPGQLTTKTCLPGQS